MLHDVILWLSFVHCQVYVLLPFDVPFPKDTTFSPAPTEQSDVSSVYTVSEDAHLDRPSASAVPANTSRISSADGVRGKSCVTCNIEADVTDGDEAPPDYYDVEDTVL